MIVLVSGSPSANSRTATLLGAVASRLSEAGRPSELFHARDLTDARTPEALARISAARALVIGTPVYKASLTGLLKSFLDQLPPDALKGKVALPIASGAAPGHALILEHQLAPVLFALGADAVVRGHYFLDSDLPDGKLSPAAAEAVAAATNRLLAFGDIQQ